MHQAPLDPRLRGDDQYGVVADTLLRMQIAFDLAQIKLRGEEPDVKRVEFAG